MWIKSDNQWININHIAYFTIQEDMSCLREGIYDVYAHLNMTVTKFTPDSSAYDENPPTPYTTAYEIRVFSGTEDECKAYVTEKTYLQQAYHWLTHLAAGLLGGLVIFLIQKN